MRPHCQKVTLSPVEYLTVEHSTLTTFGNTKITANWDFSHTSKQIYRKLQYKENVFEGFQGLSRFPWKIVWYSSTKFGVLKPWTNIPCPSRFNLGFWQTSKQIYRKLQYRKKVFGEFQDLPGFTRKMVFYSSTKFGILKPWTNIPSPRRFDLGFWQTSKQIYRQLQYKEKVLEEFEGSSGFPRKIILYSLTKFGIIKPSTNIVWLRRFNLGFWQTSKQVYRNLRCRDNVA